jgi:hypothetical protein
MIGKTRATRLNLEEIVLRMPKSKKRTSRRQQRSITRCILFVAPHPEPFPREMELSDNSATSSGTLKTPNEWR